MIFLYVMKVMELGHKILEERCLGKAPTDIRITSPPFYGEFQHHLNLIYASCFTI